MMGDVAENRGRNIDDELLEDTKADIEEAETEDEILDWPRYAAWHLSRYPEDLEVVETITQTYRFEL